MTFSYTMNAHYNATVQTIAHGILYNYRQEELSIKGSGSKIGCCFVELQLFVGQKNILLKQNAVLLRNCLFFSFLLFSRNLNTTQALAKAIRFLEMTATNGTHFFPERTRPLLAGE